MNRSVSCFEWEGSEKIGERFWGGEVEVEGGILKRVEEFPVFQYFNSRASLPEFR